MPLGVVHKSEDTWRAIRSGLLFRGHLTGGEEVICFLLFAWFHPINAVLPCHSHLHCTRLWAVVVCVVWCQGPASVATPTKNYKLFNFCSIMCTAMSSCGLAFIQATGGGEQNHLVLLPWSKATRVNKALWRCQGDTENHWSYIPPGHHYLVS